MTVSKTHPMGARAVMTLAWPVMISMLSYTAMTLVDALFVGQLGTAALAAVGLGHLAFALVLSLPHGLLRGVRVATSQAHGANRNLTVLALGWQAIWMALVLGLVLMTLAPFGLMFFSLLGASPEVTRLAEVYVRVQLLAAPILLLNFGLASWFEGRGDTRTPMVAAVIANLVNIALDAVLIPGMGPIPSLGIAGAAIATVVGTSLGAAILAWQARRHLLQAVSRRIRKDLLSEISRLGGPIGTEVLLDVIIWMILGTVLANLSDVQLAAHVLGVRVLMVSFLPGLAIAEAAGVLVGQAVGAHRFDDALHAWRSATWMGIVVMMAGGLTFVLIPGPIISTFGAEPEVMALAKSLLLLAAAFQVFDAVATVSYLSLNGAGDTRFTMLLSIGLSWGVKLPLGVGLAVWAGMGVIGAWIGLTVEIVLFAAIAVWRIYSGRWRSDYIREKKYANLSMS